LATMLDHMEANGDEGVIFYGPPGCTKSYAAKTFGRTYGLDTVNFDINGMKESHLGNSEQNIRTALKTVHSLSGGRKLWIATCNSIANINSALQRRYNYGIVFFDLPNAQQRQSVWDVQAKLFKLSSKQLKGEVKDDNWSAAEIRNCCKLAYKFDCPITEAAKDITPVAVQSPRLILGMRLQAHGKLKNADDGKPYMMPEYEQSKKNYAENGIRNIDL